MKKILKFLVRLISGRRKYSRKFFYSLDKVKADIASGKCTLIYYSTTTLWWTHSKEDLRESTDIGKAFCAKRHKVEMKNQIHNRNTRARIAGLYKSFVNAKNLPPLDFVGKPLYQTPDLKKWIEGAESHPEQFGRNGLDAFMKMHHKNCDGNAFVSWDDVNFEIDGLPVINAEIKAPVRQINPEIISRRNQACPCGSGKKYKHCCIKNDLN